MEKQSYNIETSYKHRVRVPWHLWFIGLFFIAIYVYRIYDYFMMLGNNLAYYNLKNYGEAVHAYFTDYPLLPAIFWTVNIISGLIAPILLLFRSRWAELVAHISAVCLLCLDLLTFGFMDHWHVLGPWISLFDIVILIMTFGLFLYCKAMAKRGVLR